MKQIYDNKDIGETIDKSFDAGIKEGYRRCREEMMKEAVEKTVGQEEIIMVAGHPVWGKMIALTEVDLKEFEYGDKVRIIIVKEN